MRTLFSVIFCLVVAAPLVNAGPPNPTPSDAQGNTAGGTGALLNTEGFDSTAFGKSALESNTGGNSNTASGASALRDNTTGTNNTASGVHALRFNTSGYGNIEDGYAALYANTTGVYNTGIGYHTFLRNKTGQRNTALGWGAGSLLISGSNNIYLDHPGVASESSTLRLGNVQTRAFLGAMQAEHSAHCC
jgi:hypothetical protein